MEVAVNNPFVDAFLARGPHPSLGSHADTYGRLIGSWTGEVRVHPIDAPAVTTSAEIHFAWALDGRAVQDVWITPSLPDRASGRSVSPELYGTGLYGTTLRVFNPQSESWRVVWWDPPSGARTELEGRNVGGDIVQFGMRDGRPIRWTFSEIRADSFLWQGHILEADGVSWRLQGEFRVRRSNAR
jgi:hypothetical protein